jgi:excisionase family DNA binding protein
MIERNTHTFERDRLLKPTEVAEILNVSRAMAYRLLQMGHIRVVRIGAARRVRPKDLQDFIRDNITPPPN